MMHVLPIDDLREHACSTTCWCSPRIEWEHSELLVIHNSADGREYYEQLDDMIREVES